MARTQIALRLNPDALERIDALAAKQDRLRSDVIRRCLSRGLAAEEADQVEIERAAAKRQR